MISANLTNMLSNLGWGTGFRLPVANEENKALEEMLEQKQKHLLEMSGTLETDTQHCQILKSHFERITTAVNQSQKMVHAKRTGVETEQNLNSLAERLQSRVQDDLNKAIANIKDYEERNQRMTEEVQKRKDVVDDLINTVKFDQVALEKYQQVTKDKEDYIEFMKSVIHVDERTSQDYELKFGKMGEELNVSGRALHDASMYTQTLQQQFGRLCNQFRRVHLERSQAITFWENTLKSMKQRDEDIKDIAEEYTEVRARVQHVEDQCKRNRTMLGSEKQNALHMEHQITTCDKKCGNHRMRLAEGKERTFSLNDEILAYSTIINQTSRVVKDIQVKINKHDQELATMQQKLEKAHTDLIETKARYDSANMNTLTEENRTKEIERMIDLEEHRTEMLRQEMEKQRRHMWQRSNDCSVLSEKLKFTIGRIKGTKTMITSLRDRAKNEDIKVQKKRQTAYHIELECLAMESRIQHMGLALQESSQPSGPTREGVAQMKEKLTEVLKTKAFLVGQESHMKNVNTRIQRDINAVIQDHTELKQMIENQKVEAKRFGMDTMKAGTELQNLQVENRLLQMTLSRLSSTLQQEQTKRISLEQERLMMDTAVRERRCEIDLHLGILKGRQKCLKEEKHKVHTHIVEMMAEIERHKTRYEFVINALNAPGDEPGHSESYYILKAAQEKETLKREGDLWDVKVKEAEKEIAALQNTLSVLVSSNMAFKESLAPAAADTSEAKMLSNLEDEQKGIMVRKRKSDKKLAQLNNRVLARQSETANSIHQRMFLEGLLGERKYELNNVHFEILNQKSKIDRANRMAARLIKELGLNVHDDRVAIEMDLKLRCAREKLEFALKTLEKTLFMHQELRSTTLDFLAHSELASLTNRLKKRLSATDATYSPFHSAQATPTRFLTPISSVHMLQSQIAENHKGKRRPDMDFRYLSEPNSAAESVKSSLASKQPMTKFLPAITSDDIANPFQISSPTVSSTDTNTMTIFKMLSKQADDPSFSEMFLDIPSVGPSDEGADSQDKDVHVGAAVEVPVRDTGEKMVVKNAKSAEDISKGAEVALPPEDTSKSEGEEEDNETEGNALEQITEEEEEETETIKSTDKS